MVYFKIRCLYLFSQTLLVLNCPYRRAASKWAMPALLSPLSPLAATMGLSFPVPSHFIAISLANGMQLLLYVMVSHSLEAAWHNASHSPCTEWHFGGIKWSPCSLCSNHVVTIMIKHVVLCCVAIWQKLHNRSPFSCLAALCRIQVAVPSFPVLAVDETIWEILNWIW